MEENFKQRERDICMRKAARTLVLCVLQSNLYRDNLDVRDAVDNVLAIVKDNESYTNQSSSRTPA